jgi:hydrogenase maturation factor
MDIVMIGYAGQRGAADMAARCRDELLGHLPADLVDDACGMDREYPVPEACVPYARVRIGAGGVEAGLWLMGEKLQSGLDIDLRKIPIRQETVEICEVLGLDPYVLPGGGAWLIAVPDAEAAVGICRRRQIPADLVGRTQPGAARVLRCGEILRYLERPQF